MTGRRRAAVRAGAGHGGQEPLLARAAAQLPPGVRGRRDHGAARGRARAAAHVRALRLLAAAGRAGVARRAPRRARAGRVPRGRGRAAARRAAAGPSRCCRTLFSDRTRCIAQLRPGSSYLLSALQFQDMPPIWSSNQRAFNHAKSAFWYSGFARRQNFFCVRCCILAEFSRVWRCSSLPWAGRSVRGVVRGLQALRGLRRLRAARAPPRRRRAGRQRDRARPGRGGAPAVGAVLRLRRAHGVLSLAAPLPRPSKDSRFCSTFVMDYSYGPWILIDARCSAVP